MAVLHAIVAFIELAARLHAYIHSSQGPYGWVLWVQPRGISAGLFQVHGHLGSWFETRRAQ